MPVWLTPWEWTGADWAGLQFVVLVGALLIAWRQASEARRLRREQARPFVVVDFEVETTSHLIFLVIENTGRTLARDVQTAFSPELESTWDRGPNAMPLAETKLIRGGIPTLPPGKRIRPLFDSFIERSPELGLDDVYEVRTSYWAEDRSEHYEELSVLDLGVYTNTMTVTRRDAHDIHERLKEIRDLMSKWGAGPGGGLLVLTPGAVKRRMSEWRERRASATARRAAEVQAERQPSSRAGK